MSLFNLFINITFYPPSAAHNVSIQWLTYFKTYETRSSEAADAISSSAR